MMRSELKKEPEYQIQHRLIGAGFLVVISLFMIHGVLHNQNIEINLNHSVKQINHQSFKSKITPLNANNLKKMEEMNPNSIMTLDNHPEKTTNQKDGSKEFIKRDRDNLNCDLNCEGWTVRVGTFSEQENIKLVKKLLKKSGFNPHSTTLNNSLGGKLTRIWLGPYKKQDTANAISAHLKMVIGEIGYVTKHVS